MKDWFYDTFYNQVNLQMDIKGAFTDDELPSVVDVYGSATGMIVEIGEMLQTDTRWKPFITHSKKQPIYDREKFLEEAADVYIYLMNTLIYAGISIDEFKNAVNKKQEIVKKRFLYD